MIHSIYYTHVLVPLRILSITLSYPFQLLLAWYQNDYFCVLCAATELKRIIHKSVATLPYFSISATPHTHAKRKREDNWHLIIIKCTRYSYILIWQSALQRETKNQTYFWLHFSVYDHIEYPRKGGGGNKIQLYTNT